TQKEEIKENLSPYLQQQLVEVISNSLYRPQSSYAALQKECSQLRLQNKKLIKQNQTLISKNKSLGSQNRHFRQKASHHISAICSLVSKSKKISSDNFKKQVKELFKSNYRHYSPDMIWLTTKLAQVGQVSTRSTHKQVSELTISNLAKNILQTSTFCISADKSTCGQDKNLIICFVYWDREQNYPKAKNISNDSGLKTLYISDPSFCEQFNNFCNASNPELSNYPLLYEFATTKIYYITVHQQQVEGMSNKLDLKTHLNISLDLKESKLRLFETKFSKEDIKNKIVSIRRSNKKEKKEAKVVDFDVQNALIKFDQVFNKIFFRISTDL
ncbi:13146_t:CDS:2, partial [Gigaspora margarita]